MSEEAMTDYLTPVPVSPTNRLVAYSAAHRQAPASVKSIEVQIAEALRTKGLTLVKTATGYVVLKLGEVTAQQATPAPTSQEDARDAARWRALLSCGRIRILGTAGVTGTGVHNPNALNSYKEPYGNYVHFGGEFWSTFPDQEYYNTKENPAYARATLTEFADAVLASQKT